MGEFVAVVANRVRLCLYPGLARPHSTAVMGGTVTTST